MSHTMNMMHRRWFHNMMCDLVNEILKKASKPPTCFCGSCDDRDKNEYIAYEDALPIFQALEAAFGIQPIDYQP